MKKTILLLFFCLLIVPGCQSSQSKGRPRYQFGFQDRGKYKPLPRGSYDLSLTLSPGSTELTAGKSSELIFILHNNGKKPVKLPDWFHKESSNLKVECQIWYPGTENPDPAGWLPATPQVKLPAMRYPQEILPGEDFFISCYPEFLRNIVVNPGTERRYFIRAELNSQTVSVKTKLHAIYIRPGK